MSFQPSLSFQSFVERLENAVGAKSCSGKIPADHFGQTAFVTQVTLAAIKRKLQSKRSSEKDQLADSIEADPRATAAINDIVDASLRAKVGKRRLSSELAEWRRKSPRIAKTKSSKDADQASGPRKKAASKRRVARTKKGRF